MKKSRYEYPVPEMQDDSVTIIANPVSGTKYGWRAGDTGSGAELGSQKNVRLIGIEAHLTWAVTQPTPLEIHVTIDGVVYTFTQVDPVSATEYIGQMRLHVAPANNSLGAVGAWSNMAYLLEGRSVKVEVEITWATTQPTNLTLRVKWAKW
jgi:hypothetical protein